jgi:hypothetical protein
MGRNRLIPTIAAISEDLSGRPAAAATPVDVVIDCPRLCAGPGWEIYRFLADYRLVRRI